MTPSERRASLALASISSLRLAGMFIVLPVLSLYAERLPGGADHTLIGLALGAYGLTQALMQVPFGWASDRFGRKRTIHAGLLVFACGSFLSAWAPDIGWLVAGRVLQGAGAVSAAVIALTADLTREEVRTRAMAIIGVTIGTTFALSMAAGPVLDRWIGVPGIFALTGVGAFGAMAVLHFAVADPPEVPAGATDRVPVLHCLADPDLLRINVGVFVLHAVLMALFVVVPFQLRQAGLAAPEQWRVYLPVVLGSFALIVPIIAVSERRQRQKAVFVAAVAALWVSVVMLWALPLSVAGVASGLLVFFVAFNFLEASLPALVSRAAPASSKGTATGLYSSVQFLGTFLGAAAGGWLSQHAGRGAVALACAVAVLGWLWAAVGMRVPVTRTYRFPAAMDAACTEGLIRRLGALPGVREARVLASGQAAQLKVDTARFDEDNALQIIHGGTAAWLPSTK